MEIDKNGSKLNLSSYVVNFELVKTNMGGDERLARSLFGMFLQSLPEEMVKLQAYHKQESWGQLKAAIHQLKGGASYCGTERLNQVCAHLEEAIVHSHQNTMQSLYQQYMIELTKVREVIQDYLRKFEEQISLG